LHRRDASLAGALGVILRQHHRSLSAEQMDARFVERMIRAIERGLERLLTTPL
jgi:hypothetical protein